MPQARRAQVQEWLDGWSDLAEDAAGGSLARVAVLTGLETKGLEFDGIVVVAPDEIEAESVTGRATLYVVLHPGHAADGHGQHLSGRRRTGCSGSAAGRPAGSRGGSRSPLWTGDRSSTVSARR